MLKTGLSNKHKQLVITILQMNQHIESALLFGSRAIGTYKNSSDIDIALIGEKLTLTDIANIQVELEQTTLPYHVDLVIKQTITSPELHKHIETFGIKWI